MWGNDAYTNMDAATKDAMHDNWVDQQERDAEFDDLINRLQSCYNKRHPDEPWDEQTYNNTRALYKYKVTELKRWVNEMEQQDINTGA